MYKIIWEPCGCTKDCKLFSTTYFSYMGGEEKFFTYDDTLLIDQAFAALEREEDEILKIIESKSRVENYPTKNAT
jgi:hypothetical protein